MPASITVTPDWNLGGSGIGTPGPPMEWAPVFADVDQVYADGDEVMVPLNYANA